MRTEPLGLHGQIVLSDLPERNQLDMPSLCLYMEILFFILGFIWFNYSSLSELLSFHENNVDPHTW